MKANDNLQPVTTARHTELHNHNTSIKNNEGFSGFYLQDEWTKRKEDVVANASEFEERRLSL